MTAVDGMSFRGGVIRWQIRLLALLAVMACLAPAQAAGAMRCGSRLIDEGKLAIEVLAACGEPDYRDPWVTRHPRMNSFVADVEEWYYNFGPNQLLRVVRLRNGRVRAIEADGYGFHDASPRRCSPTQIVPGESKFRLLVRCGEPAQRRASEVLVPYDQREYRRGRDGVYRRPRSDYIVPVYREEWIYNFGSHYLLRIVTLEDGRVSDVQNGDRGFD